MDFAELTAREPWLADFFGNGNGIGWADLVAGASPWGASLRPWLELIAAGRVNQGLVLPALAADGLVTWHAFAAMGQDRAALAEQLISFVGYAWVELEPARAPRHLTPHEQILVQRFAVPVQRFVARVGNEPADVSQALAMLAGLLSRRPPRLREVRRPFATVRTEFEQALLTPDEARARRCIDELRSTGRLSATNERFLHVRLLVALGREAALVQDGTLMSMLTDAELPIRVLREVIEALYTVHLAPLHDELPVEAWVEAFRKHVRRHERLLRSRRGLRAPAVLRVFLLHELARAPDEIRAAEVAAIYDALAALPQQRGWADAVLRWSKARGAASTAAGPAEAASPESVVTTAPAAATPNPAMTERPATVAEWAACSPSARALTGLLQAATAVGTLEAAAQALGAVHAYPNELLQGLSPIQQGMLRMLAGLVPAEPVPVSDWTEWARWLAAAAPEEAERALAIAEQGAEQWDHAAWFADTAKVREFAALLQAHPSRFRPYLANIHASLYDVAGSAAAQADVLVQMAMVVALDAPQPTDLPMLADWATWLVHLGAGRALCDEMAGALHAAWSEVRSLRCLDWACDVVESLASAPRTPGGELESLFSNVIGLALGQQHRLTGVQQRMLELLARDFGLQFAPLEVPAVAQEPAADPVDFKDLFIGIYTLQESVVAHLRTALKVALPGARVEFNHDHVATPALEHMARHSDVMVFAWRCSKHQAFYCIQQQRPAERPLLQPQGRGSASILRELEKHFGLQAAVA